MKKKTELIPSSEIKCPKFGIFTNNHSVRELGKVILQVRTAVFQVLSKSVLAKDGSGVMGARDGSDGTILRHSQSLGSRDQ